MLVQDFTPDNDLATKAIQALIADNNGDDKAATLDSLLDLTLAPRDDWPNFAASAHTAVIPQIQAAAAKQAPLSDLQHETVKHAISLNATLPKGLQVRQPDGVHEQAGQAGAFVKAVGDAAIAAHQEIKQGIKQ